MFAIPVEDLPLSKREQAFCKRADVINASQLLFASPEDDIQIRHLFDATDAEYIREVAARTQAPKLTSVLDGLQALHFDLEGCFREEDDASSVSVISAAAPAHYDDQMRKADTFLTLTSGDEDMDALLGGGWRRGCLSEIVGESSSGKSQLIMQTAVFAALGLTHIKQEAPTRSSRSQMVSDGDDLYDALKGCGIGKSAARGSVAILHSGGHGVGRMMIRRMEQLAASLIEERWDHMRNRGRFSQGSSKGMFQDASSANSIKEVQCIARKMLLENLHIASPQGYDTLEHAVTYTLPTLYESIKSKGKAPLSMVLMDDLPEIILDEGERLNQKEYTKRRSRMLSELADRLKRLAILPSQQLTTQGAANIAIIAVNHVVGLFPKNLSLTVPGLGDEEGNNDEMVAAGPPPLHSAYQESYYDGSLINGDIALLQRRVKEGSNSYEEKGKRAALGFPWVNCINVRIVMIKTKKEITIVNPKNKREEILSVRKAIGILNPFVDCEQQLDFVIRHQGTQSLSKCRWHSRREDTDEEDGLWSSLDEEISAADMDRLLQDEERLRAGTQM